MYREDIDEDESRQARDALKRVKFDLPEDSDGEEMEQIFGGKSEKLSKSSFEKRKDKVCLMLT